MLRSLRILPLIRYKLGNRPEMVYFGSTFFLISIVFYSYDPKTKMAQQSKMLQMI